MPMALWVEPSLIIEAHRVHHQRVAFPMADRVAHPIGVWIRWVPPPVQVDGAVAGNVVLKEHHKPDRSLHDFVRKERSRRGDAASQAARAWSILGVAGDALLKELLNP